MTRALLFAATVVAIVLTAAPGARAQADPTQHGEVRGIWPHQPGDIARLFEPDFLGRDLPLIRDALDLDKGQTTIAEALLFDYRLSFLEASDAIREEIGGMRPQLEGQAERRAQRRELSERKRAVREQLLELKAEVERGDARPEATKALREQLDAVRAEIEDLKPPRPQGMELQQLNDNLGLLSGEWRRTRETLKATFLADLRAMLTETQEERWPAFERTMRRQRKLTRGRLSGEGVDLFVVVRDIGLSPRQTDLLKEVLDAYALELDDALVQRDEHLDSDRAALFDVMIAGDVNRAGSLLGTEMGLRTAIREVNERYRQTIAEQLEREVSPESSAQFIGAYRQRAYPRIYRRTRVERAFSVVDQIEDLDDATRTAVEALREEYAARLEERNVRLEELTRAHEPEREKTAMRRRVAARHGLEAPRDDDPIRDAFRRRTVMDDRYRDRLESMLSPQHAAMLPPSRLDLVEKLDTDGDGWLSRDEREADG